VNRYVLNDNDTSGGQSFGGGDHSNYMTLTAASTAAVPEASSFIFGGIVCIALAGVHFGRKLYPEAVSRPLCHARRSRA
jgi:hypothetical protein